jgi:hypothetical protein
MKKIRTYLQSHLAGYALLLTCAVAPTLSLGQAPLTPQAKFNPGENAIDVTWTRCAYPQDATTCPTVYAIYRMPPATAATTDATFPETLSGREIPNNVVTWEDPSAQPGTSYRYEICTGTKKLKDESNCASTPTAVLFPKPAPPPPSSSCSSPDDTPCSSGYAPPTRVTATVYLNAVMVQWVNPDWGGEPPPFIQINADQYAPAYFDVIASLPVNPGVSAPTKYGESAGGGPGTLVPHNTATFQVCEGMGYVYSFPQPNCAKSGPVTLGGLDPVLSVAASGANAATITVAVDNPKNLTAIDVVRQESDDPARQGTTLGNGLQGCRLSSPVPGQSIHCTNTPVLHLDIPKSTTVSGASFVVGTDQNLTPGIVYYYTATATWFGSLQQTSQVVAFADSRTYPGARGERSLVPAGDRATVPVKGHAPPPGQDGKVATSRVHSVASLRRPATGSASDLLARGKGFCTAGMTEICANVLQMTINRAHMMQDTATQAAAEQQLAAARHPAAHH